MIGFSDDNGNTYTMVGGSAGNSASRGGEGSATGAVDAASAIANNEPDPGF